MTYPRETVEFQAVSVTVDGVVVTTGVAFSVVAYGARPATFTAATILSGKTGVMVSGLGVGSWQVYAQVTDAPEVPVIDCGYFVVD